MSDRDYEATRKFFAEFDALLEERDALRAFKADRMRIENTLVERQLRDLRERDTRIARLEEALSYIAGFVGLDREHRVREVARNALSQDTESPPPKRCLRCGRVPGIGDAWCFDGSDHEYTESPEDA